MGGCYYSDDNGRTWQECRNYVDLPLRGAEEPKIAELRDGRLMMIMRTQLGSVFKSISEDGGASWSRGQTTGLMAGVLSRSYPCLADGRPDGFVQP